MPRKIRCVTFDCYGTIIDWEGGIRRALLALPAFRADEPLASRVVERREEVERTLLVSAPELPKEDDPAERYEALPYRPYREILAESLRLAAGEVGVSLDPAQAQQAAETMPDWEPFPDAREAIAGIKTLFPIALLTNAEEDVARAAVRRLGVRFDLVVTSEIVGAYKPAPDHWYAAMHELEAEEDELFHLAASPFHDLETASLLGIPCGHVNRSGNPPAEGEARPAFVVRNLMEAAARLRGRARAAARQTSGSRMLGGMALRRERRAGR